MSNPKMSYEQVQHLLQLFQNVSSGRFSTLMRSGLLSDLSKAGEKVLEAIDRDEFRLRLGMYELNPIRKVKLLSDEEVHRAVRKITEQPTSCFTEFKVDPDFQILDALQSVKWPEVTIRFVREGRLQGWLDPAPPPEGFRDSTFREIVSFVAVEDRGDMAFIAEDRPIFCGRANFFAPKFQVQFPGAEIYFTMRGHGERDLALGTCSSLPRAFWRPLTKLF